jgi:cbb3-type cytochrome oxidase cytochrome c subunit
MLTHDKIERNVGLLIVLTILTISVAWVVGNRAAVFPEVHDFTGQMSLSSHMILYSSGRARYLHPRGLL